MIIIQLPYILITVKLAFISLLYKNKNLISENISKIFFYDIMIDLANLLIELPAHERPIWFNLFMGTGLIAFLVKTYSLEEIFKKLSDQKIKFSLLKKICAGFSLFHFIYYIYLWIENNYTAQLFKISGETQRHILDIYLNRFCTSIFPIIILSEVIYKTHKNIQKKEFSSLIHNEIKNLFYYGFCIKMFFDSFQTATIDFIKIILIGSDITFFSPLISLFASLATFPLMYHFYIFTKRYNEINELFNNKTILTENEINKLNLEISPDILNTYSTSDSRIIDNIIINAIQKKFSISENDIIIFHYDVLRLSILDKKNTSLINTLQTNEHINKILFENNFISIEILKSCIFINNYNYLKNNKEVIIELKKFLVEHNISFIGSIKHQEINSPEKINGFFIIKGINNFFDLKSIKYLIQINKFIEDIYEKILCKNTYLIEKLRGKKEKENLELIYQYHKQIINYLDNFEQNIHIQKMNLYKEKMEQIPVQKSSFIIKKHFSSNQHELIIQHKDKKYEQLKITLPIIQQKLYEENSLHSPLIIRLSHIGNEIHNMCNIPTNEFQLFREYLIEEFLNRNHSLLEMSEDYLESFFSFYRYISKKNIHIVNIKEYPNVLSIFEKYDPQKNKFIIDSMTEDDILVFTNIDFMEPLNQKKIFEYIIHEKHPLGKKYNSMPYKIIFTIQQTKNIHNVYSKILEIAQFKKMINPLLNELSEEQFNELSINILNITHPLSNQKIPKETMELILHNRQIWKTSKSLITLFHLLKSIINEKKIDHLININDIDNIILEATVLGKNALQNQLIMETLLKHYNQNQIATLLGVHRSSISRYIKNLS
jgi:hypothetical protein